MNALAGWWSNTCSRPIRPDPIMLLLSKTGCVLTVVTWRVVQVYRFGLGSALFPIKNALGDVFSLLPFQMRRFVAYVDAAFFLYPVPAMCEWGGWVFLLRITNLV